MIWLLGFFSKDDFYGWFHFVYFDFWVYVCFDDLFLVVQGEGAVGPCGGNPGRR